MPSSPALQQTQLAPFAQEQTELSVKIAGALYRAQSDDFAVLAASEENRGSIVLTGPIGYLQEGEQLTVQGRWREHPRYGLRFEVRSVRHPEQRSGAALLAALSAVKHIGPRGAQLLLERHGQETLAVIDEDPVRALRSLPGIGAVRSREAAESWRQLRAGRELRMFLAEHEVPAAVAARIQRNWGERSLSSLKERPYELCSLPGMGFRSADALARSLGVRADAPERIDSAVAHALTEAEQDGHCNLPVSMLQSRSARLLADTGSEAQDNQESPALLVAERIEELVAAGRLLAPEGLQEHRAPIYLPQMYESERRLAEYISELVQAEPVLDRSLAARELDGAFTPTQAQWQSVLSALGCRLSILTGGPGTGKTASVRALVHAASDQGARIGLCAPTGKAAKRLAQACGQRASTIHRLLEWQPGHDFMRDRQRRLEGLGMLIVDEASMLSLRLAEALFAAVGEQCHVLLVGDVDQLAPVGAGRVLDDLIASEVAPVCSLSEIFRQARRSLIVRAAHAINAGSAPPRPSSAEMTDLDGPAPAAPAPDPGAAGRSPADQVSAAETCEDDQVIKDFFWLRRPSEQEVCAEVIALACRRIPSHFGLEARRDIQVLAPMHRGPAGLEALNAAIGEQLNPDGVRVGQSSLRVGDRVIQTRNDYEHELMNGEVALLKSADPSRERVLLEVDGERVLALPYSALESLQPAYAISIHKAQGSQSPVVIVALGRAQRMMLTRNLLYTAVTRAERLCVVVAQNGAVEMALGRRDSRARHTGLAALLKAGRAGG